MRKRWRQILRDAPLNVLRPIDSAILTDFVVNEALAEQALAGCGGELVVEGEKAKARNPYLLVYFKAIEAKRAAMRELGFTPARARRLADRRQSATPIPRMSAGNGWSSLARRTRQSAPA